MRVERVPDGFEVRRSGVLGIEVDNKSSFRACFFWIHGVCFLGRSLVPCSALAFSRASTIDVRPSICVGPNQPQHTAWDE